MASVADRRGWGKTKAVANYAGISERTLEKWLHDGLDYVQLPSGLRLISYDAVDAYLKQFEKTEDRVEQIAGETLAEFKSRLN